MKNILTVIATFLLLQFALSASAQNTTGEKIECLRVELAKVKTPKDSIKILYDIFDLSPREDYREVSLKIIGAAKRSNDVMAELDILRQVSKVITEDEDYQAIIDELNSLQEAEELRDTKLFIEMKRVQNRAHDISDEARRQELTELIASLESGEKQDKYDKMLTLFSIVEYLRDAKMADMLDDYTELLIEEADQQSFKLYAIPNLIYSEVAYIYTNASDQKRAVKIDEKLLDIISSLEKKYAKLGRQYRNYDLNKYNSYKRLLRNYQGLEPGESAKIYAKIIELGKSNSLIALEIESDPSAKAYYHMSIGEYSQALPYLKQLYSEEESLAERKHLAEQMIKAAQAVGDNQTLAFANEEYSKINEEYEQLSREGQYESLRILYDAKTLLDQTDSIKMADMESELQKARAIMWIAIGVFLAMAIAFFIILYHWGRHRQNTEKLTELANHMTNERNRLRHDLFFDYSNDKEARESDRMHWEQLEKIAKKSHLDYATFMIQLIINDMLHIAMMGKNSRDSHIRSVSFDTVIRRAASIATQKGENGHRLAVTYPDDDFMIVTDREALSLMIGHLLHATAINTPPTNGVSLDYRHVDGKVEFIFTAERYMDMTDDSAVYDTILSLESMIRIPESGMYADRVITLLLASEMKYDKTYLQGTRFIFTTPDDLLKG